MRLPAGAEQPRAQRKREKAWWMLAPVQMRGFLRVAVLSCPPHRFLIDERLRYACRALVQTDASIAEVGRTRGSADEPSRYVPAPQSRPDRSCSNVVMPRFALALSFDLPRPGGRPCLFASLSGAVALRVTPRDEAAARLA
jgi:hypothetical protein